jgi:hypothetical protein
MLVYGEISIPAHWCVEPPEQIVRAARRHVAAEPIVSQ